MADSKTWRQYLSELIDRYKRLIATALFTIGFLLRFAFSGQEDFISTVLSELGTFVAAVVAISFIYEQFVKKEDRKLFLADIEEIFASTFVADSDKSHTVTLRDRQDPSLQTDILQKKEIKMLGLMLRGTTMNNFHAFKSKAKNGIKISALITNIPECDTGLIVDRFSRGAKVDHFISDYEHVLAQYQDIKASASDTNNIQLRTIGIVPPYSLYIFPANNGEGIIYVELYGYKSANGSVPKFRITQKQHPQWYSHFSDQFELLWNDGNDTV